MTEDAALPVLDDYIRRASEYVARKVAIREVRYYGSQPVEVIRPTVEVHIDGSLVKVNVGRLKIVARDVNTAAGARGEVTSFSRSSRRRLMRLIAKTDRSDKPLFVTLTYPGSFDSSFDGWKRDIDVFGKRFARRFGEGSFVWRLEFKKRKTGAMKGEVAPHFHLLVWGVGLSDARSFADKAWYETVGSGDQAHLRAGVSCQHLRRWSGTISYVSKYLAKVEDMPAGWKGRVWGVVLRKNIPWSAVVVISISNEVAVRSTRLARKMLRLKGKTLRYGITFLVRGDRFLDYLEWAFEQE